MRHKNYIKERLRCFVGLEHAFFSKMSEELSSGHIFHEDIEVLCILSESFEIDLSDQ